MNDNSYEETMTSSYIECLFHGWCKKEIEWIRNECHIHIVVHQDYSWSKDNCWPRWRSKIEFKNGQHTSANHVPHGILWYGKNLSIALCVLTHSMCFLYLWGLGDSHGLTSRERFQVPMRGWHQELMIMIDKGKFKIAILKDYMLEACGWLHDERMKMNTMQCSPHGLWGSYLKSSPSVMIKIIVLTWAKHKRQHPAQMECFSQRYYFLWL